jgi:hypothetical protein
MVCSARFHNQGTRPGERIRHHDLGEAFSEETVAEVSQTHFSGLGGKAEADSPLPEFSTASRD